MTALAIVQLAGSAFMKGALDDIWGLFLVLQLCAYMSVYETPVPANSELYMDEFRKMVKFEILKPDNLVGLWLPGFKLQDYLASARAGLSGSMESSGQSDSFIVNMAIYIFALSAFLSALGVLYCLLTVKKLQVKVRAILEGVRKKTFWNNTIRSLTISYLETAIQMSLQVQLLASQPFDISKAAAPVGMFCFLVAYPCISIRHMLKHRAELDHPPMRAQVEKLYAGIALGRERHTVLYYPLAMLRRLVYVLIPLTLRGHPGLQLQVLCFLESLYVIWYGAYRPHWQRREALLEVANEAFLMLLFYHLLCFTLFNATAEGRYVMGWSYLAVLAAMVLVNVAVVAQKAVEKLRRKRELKVLRKNWLERQAIWEILSTKSKLLKEERARRSRVLKKHIQDMQGLTHVAPGFKDQAEEDEFDAQLDAIIGTKYKPPAERKKVVPNVYQQKLEALRAASKERQRRAGLETIKEEPMQSPTARSEESEHPEHEDAPALAALA